MTIRGICERHVLFTYSSARETLRSIEVLLHPAHHAEQMPWLRAARRRLPAALRAEIRHFRFFFEPSAEVFPMLWKGIQKRSLQSEIEELRDNSVAYRDSVIRRLSAVPLLKKDELEKMRRPSWYRRVADDFAERTPYARLMLDEFVASPRRSLERFCAMLASMYALVVEPVWGAVETDLLEDAKMRRHLLEMHGVTPLLRTLSSELSVQQGSSGGSADIEFQKGTSPIQFTDVCRIELSPSYFCWPHLEMFVLRQPRGVRCLVTYPIPPLPSRIIPLRDRRAVMQIASVLGDETRLRIIELLRARDLSTRELAGFLKIAAPLVSRHLSAMLSAGLVERARSGYFVMYRLRAQAVLEVAETIRSLV